MSLSRRSRKNYEQKSLNENTSQSMIMIQTMESNDGDSKGNIELPPIVSLSKKSSVESLPSKKNSSIDTENVIHKMMLKRNHKELASGLNGLLATENNNNSRGRQGGTLRATVAENPNALPSTIDSSV